MERSIKQKIDAFSMKFKHNMKEWLNEHSVIDNQGNDTTHDFIQFIYDFETLVLEEDDFKKRKRIKIQIPNYERCCALRCNNERCTRKKKERL